MVAQILLLILGFIFLIKGADWLVRGGSSLAKRYGVSDLAIGLTVVAFGTSAPELVVNVVAASQNQPDIVLGNIIGSNNFNLFVILGIAGLIAPLIVQSSTVWKEIPFSILAVLLLYLLGNSFLFSSSSILSRVDGIILFGLFLLFLFYVFNQLRKEKKGTNDQGQRLTTPKSWVYVSLGLVLLIIGGRLVVTNSVRIATELGVSQYIIGVTIVAAGTSLPELATSVVATIRGNNDIAVGNIIGSNIFNVFFILSVSSLITPIKYNVSFNQDLYLLALGTLVLFLAMFSGKRKKLDRWEAGVLLLVYVGYTLYLIL